jgi:hypothetical protein
MNLSLYRIVVTALFWLTMAVCTHAHAIPVLTLKSQGSIVWGNDISGIFGLLGGSLAGQQYEMTMRVEPFSTAYQTFSPSYISSTIRGEFNPASQSPHLQVRTLSFEVVVNGVAYSVPLRAANFGIGLENRLTQEGVPYDHVYGWFNGGPIADEQLQFSMGAASASNTFVDTLSFQDRTLSYMAQPGDVGKGTFQVQGAGILTNFERSTTSLTLEISGVVNDFIPPSPVPEPSTSALLLMALSALWVRHRYHAVRG